jgi:hypothetical protein
MSKRRQFRVLSNRAGMLLLLTVVLAGFLSCIPASRPSPVLEPPPGGEVETPTEPPPFMPPEKKPEAAKAAEPEEVLPADLELMKKMVVSGSSTWTDTGLDVEEGQQIFVKGTGGISLQRGNPTAFCGPEGKNLQTAQQPLPDKNIGALVGRVVRLISVSIDPATKKETRNELIEVFYIGSESRVLIPIRGRLFLGINENIAGDNSGEFNASIFRVKEF